jgi:hypothetical protein
MASSSALRIRYEYDQDGVRAVSRTPVEMIVPDPVTPPPEPDQAGLWCELQDSAGRRLYHWVLSDSLGSSAEVFSKEPGEPIHRTAIVDGSGAFDVILPDVPEGRVAALYGPHHPSGRLGHGPVRYELADIPETAPGNTP